MSNQKETQTIYTTSKKINAHGTAGLMEALANVPGTTLMEGMESERGTTLTEGMVKEHGITLMEVMENAAQNLMKKVKHQPNKVENLPLCQITTSTSHKRCCLSSLFPKNPKKSSKNTTELLFTTTTLDIIQLSSTYYKYHKKLPKSHTTTMSNPALLDKKMSPTHLANDEYAI